MERSLGSWVREPGKCPPRSKVEQDLPSLSFSRSTSAPHAPGGPRSSLGFQGARSPGGAGERGAPDPRAAPPGRRPCPAPRFSPSRATPGGSVPTAHAPFPCSPPRHPRKHCSSPRGPAAPHSPRREASSARGSRGRRRAVRARLSQRPLLPGLPRGGGGGVAPAGSPSPARHPGPPPGPPARRRQVPPRGAVSCQPLPLQPSPRRG